jgi:phosphatidylglycerol lysyltransferase
MINRVDQNTRFLYLGFLLLYSYKTQFQKKMHQNESQREKAKFLLSQFGNYANDYFKVYKDKLYFFSDFMRHLLHTHSRGFAIVLEGSRYVLRKTK